MMLEKKLFWVLLVFTCFLSKKAYAQDIDLENVYKPNFKVSGAVNANAVFYNSNQDSSREPFTYLLSGSLNFSAFSFSVPVFYSITNQGENSGYTAPFDFNRICITPKYKWIKAYIGNASMTFSPYTLSGIPFKGIGLELTPRIPFKISLMGGQIFKAVTEDRALGGVPIYERYGYGVKTSFEKEKYKIGWVGFYARDNENSLFLGRDEKGIAPKENLVNSLTFNTSLLNNLTFDVEYAMSALTEDSRADKRKGGNLRDKIFSANQTTSYLNALNVNFDYSIQKSKLGLTYERIDPNYYTLGAMYFNNDLENIAMRFSRSFYKEKINFSTSLGYQRDNLAKDKKQDSKRVVGSLNMNYKISDQLGFTGSYSNFSTYTNRNPDQFELINNPIVVPADTLDYRQLSQNSNFSLMYAFGKKKNQNVNFNYGIASQANEQGGVIRRGQTSTVQNYSVAHTINFTGIKTSLNSSLNYTNNEVARSDNSAVGASLGVSKKLLKDKMNTNFGLLYNTSQSNITSSVFGIKFNNTYALLQKHNFTLGLISMYRSTTNKPQNNDVTLNFNYGYSF